jgi:cyclophilin family peptidyl-prolyl cis-trans isomerase
MPTKTLSAAILAALLLAACAKNEAPDAAPTTTAPDAATTSTSAPAASPDGCDFSAPPPASGKQYAKAPTMTIDPSASYTAVMDTSCGAMMIDLLAEGAPKTVNNFVFLSEQGWYDGIRFHRLANSISVIQAGDPLCGDRNDMACGSGGPGYQFEDELSGRESYLPGVVAMANAGPNTNGSQFFIVTGPDAKPLPPNYTVFGRLADDASLEVARTIQALPVTGETPIDDIWIQSVTIEEG